MHEIFDWVRKFYEKDNGRYYKLLKWHPLSTKFGSQQNFLEKTWIIIFSVCNQKHFNCTKFGIFLKTLSTDTGCYLAEISDSYANQYWYLYYF